MELSKITNNKPEKFSAIEWEGELEDATLQAVAGGAELNLEAGFKNSIFPTTIPGANYQGSGQYLVASAKVE